MDSTSECLICNKKGIVFLFINVKNILRYSFDSEEINNAETVVTYMIKTKVKEKKVFGICINCFKKLGVNQALVLDDL